MIETINEILQANRPFDVGMHVMAGDETFLLARKDREGNTIDINRAVRDVWFPVGSHEQQDDLMGNPNRAFQRNHAVSGAANLESLNMFLTSQPWDAFVFVDILPIFVRDIDYSSFEGLEKTGIDSYGDLAVETEECVESESGEIPAEVVFWRSQNHIESTIRPVDRCGKFPLGTLSNSQVSLPPELADMGTDSANEFAGFSDSVQSRFQHLLKLKMKETGSGSGGSGLRNPSIFKGFDLKG